MMDRLEWIL